MDGKSFIATGKKQRVFIYIGSIVRICICVLFIDEFAAFYCGSQEKSYYQFSDDIMVF